MQCLVLGTGDIGSAVAHALHKSGHRAILVDDPAPVHARRGMSFVDAVYDGAASLSGVMAKRVGSHERAMYMLRCPHAIPVVVDSIEGALALVHPDVLIDARMRKQRAPGAMRGMAKLTIGLGPNFIAGENVDVAVETSWGPELGRVIASGPTKPLAGEPKEIAGVGRERYVYAPKRGCFRSSHTIGDRVRAGEVVATLDDQAIAAPIAGCVRGLTRSGASVEPGTKVIEIDPRNDPSKVIGIGERPARISLGVLEALQLGDVRQ